MSSSLKLLLIQARNAGDPMADHELECFAQGCELRREQFSIFNAVVDDFEDFDPTGADAVMIGGSGDFSLAEGGFDWHDDFLDLIRSLAATRIPTFGSCFGFQAIVQALGGKLDTDDSRAEVGTFTITSTKAAAAHSIFGTLPQRFDAQLGHNDSAIELPDDVVHLASSERCEYQAIKVRNLPIIATQFHPELTHTGSLARFRNYLESYRQPGHDVEDAMAHAREMHRPSPHSSSLLRSFIGDIRRSW